MTGNLRRVAWSRAVRQVACRVHSSITADHDRGSVTIEFVAVFPVFVVLMVVGLIGVHGMAVEIRCVDAAREAVRAEARGDSGDQAGRAAAPAGATVSIQSGQDLIRAKVSAYIKAPLISGFTVSGSATALREPGNAQ